MNIAVIPARGGSKRIPRKNIKKFFDLPMISYAISAAHESSLFERIIVSTDDEEIAELAVRLGAEVPFMRPANLADDYVPTVPVIAHAIEACQTFISELKNVCCIYPCVPFIQIEDLSGALHLLNERDVNYSFPITEFPSAVQRALRCLTNNRLQPFYSEFQKTRTQDLEAAYYDAGQFYWGKVESWLRHSDIHESSAGYLIPSWRVVDIDTVEDWRRAEVLFKTIFNK